ncbi:hypothetical protein KUV86_16240 [Halomonas sp. DP8Y7-3]|uniref:hypothetical protein n=1 Tax=Halomonas sp. DP8Y7-3 TaxID=2859079 RepID=UPI001C97E0D2|nr:hypothetical protein [Halomonas sp. DP8Y7-3]MBY5930663.1 hypothetical protein [Halomonas sp. DP8Y7-3]
MNAKPMLALTAALWLGTALTGCSDDSDTDGQDSAATHSDSAAADGAAASSAANDTAEQGADDAEPALSGDARRAALEDSLKANFDPQLGEVRYLIGWSDLNDDGREEAIVHVVGPMVCGTGGCDTLILEAQGDTYRVISAQPTTQPPIQLGDAAHEGWQDLLVRRHVAADEPAQTVRLRFDGNSYVETQDEQATADPAGETLIADFGSLEDARPLFDGDAEITGSMEGEMEAMTTSDDEDTDPDDTSAAEENGTDETQAESTETNT